MTDKPWLDASLAIDQRIELLLSEMSLADKANQLNLRFDLDPVADADHIKDGALGGAVYARGAIPQIIDDDNLGLVDRIAQCQRVAVEQSRLGIPLMFARDDIHGHRTIQPIPLGLASSWDATLAEACAAAAATEAAADGINWTFAPMVDITTEPRWGRVAESLGDSPALAGRLAAGLVTGFQSGQADAGVRTLSTCAKHFCGYGLVQAGHDHETLSVGETTLRNVHLRPFREAIAAGCQSVMVGFHDIDGVPMHLHRHLIRDVLKGEWDFSGVVVSDWNGISQLVNQGFASDLREAAAQALRAGVDVDMVSGAYRDYLPDLVESGALEPELLDDAVRRMLRLKFASGLFEDPYPHTTPAHPKPTSVEVAGRAALSSLVLLKNNGVLPLHRHVGQVHLCGPFVNEGEALLGTWAAHDRDLAVPTPAEVFTERLGAEQLLISDGRFADLSLYLTRAADVTIALFGEHPSRSGEDRCIASPELPPGQLDVLRELAALGKPLIAVILTGRPLILDPVFEIADAVLLAWHPGIGGAAAIADAVLGLHAPLGRLPMAFPRSSFSQATGQVERGTGRRFGREVDAKFGGYLNSLVHPELSLGYGLGYTTFAYSAPEISKGELSVRSGTARVTVEVANTGSRPGRDIVQLYVRDLVATIARPVVELADWRAIELEPGASTKVTFKITAQTFGYYDSEMSWRTDPGDVDVIVGPNAALGQSARLTLVE